MAERMTLLRHARGWWMPAVALTLLLVGVSCGAWRASATGAQVQVPMFYDDHYVYPRAWTQAQEAPGIPDPFPLAFYGPNSVSQTFTSAAGNLSLVEVWLAGPPQMVVSATLQDEANQSYSASLSLDQGRSGDWYRLALPPIGDTAGHVFRLTLQATAASAGDPVVTGAVGGDRLGRSIQLNEFQRPGNLVLHTYARGAPGAWWLRALGEQLLPSAFRLRLQQYKPPIFKGNAFALLLGLSVLLSGATLFLARPAGPSWRGLANGTATLLLLFLAWQVASGRLILSDGRVQALAAAEAEPADLGAGQPRLTHDLIQLLWTAERRPEERFISTALTPRPALTVPATSAVQYALDLPPNARLLGSAAVAGQGALAFTVTFNESVLFDKTIAGGEPPADLDLDLSPWQGQGGKLTLSTRPVSGLPEGRWLQPQVLALTDWVLPELPGDLVARRVDTRFGNDVTLLAYDLASTGERLAVTLFWQADRPILQPYKVFVHARDGAGNIVTQSDAQPVANSYPTTVWIPGTVIVDVHVLTRPADAPWPPAGFAIGLYDPQTLVRLPAADAAGSPLANDQALLPTP